VSSSGKEDLAVGLTYEDFSLWIEPDANGGGVQVRSRCQGGEGKAPFRVPETLTSRFAAVTPGRRPEEEYRDTDPSARRALPRLARQDGEALFGSLFAGEVGRLFERSRGAFADPQRGLRIRIHVDPSLGPEIRDLPWELLSCPDSRDQFGLHRLLPVVRFLEVPRAAEEVAFEPPLRVLVAAASPPEAAPLNLAREIELVRAVLQEAGAGVHVLEHASLEAVRETLRRDTFHVFHFMGHATFDVRTGVGSLLLESTTGGEERVAGDVLARHLHDCRLRVATLNACQSAQSGAGGSSREAFGGAAAALVQGGLPAVVAMRQPVPDRAAITFSRALYRELAAGEPIEAAVSEGRLAIYRGDPASINWAIPALFQRASRRVGSEPAVQPAAAPATAAPEEPDSIHFGEASQIEAGSLDLVNQWGSDTSASRVGRIRNDGQIKVSGHMIIANRKSGNPPES
jgi:hypothetical protein